MSHQTLDPEKSGTLPRIAQLAAAMPLASLVPRAWLRVLGAALDGARRAQGDLHGGMCVQKLALGQPGWCGLFTACPPAQLGIVWGWEAFLLSVLRFEGGRQVTCVVALPPALGFPILLLLHYFGKIMVRTRRFMCRDTHISQTSQGKGNSLNFSLLGHHLVGRNHQHGAHQSAQFGPSVMSSSL